MLRKVFDFFAFLDKPNGDEIYKRVSNDDCIDETKDKIYIIYFPWQQPPVKSMDQWMQLITPGLRRGLLIADLQGALA